MTRPKKKGVKTPTRVLNDAKTMRALEIIGTRARQFRDDVRAELESSGIRVVNAGNIETQLEPYNGVGSVSWRCWTFDFPEEH